MPPVKVTVETSGPFFTKDPVKTFRQNVREGLSDLVDEGESRVLSAVTFARGPEPYHIEDDVFGRINALSGKPWALTGVVSVPNARRGYVFAPYGRRLEAKTHFFARGVRGIRTQRRQLNDLLKGLT